MEDLLSIIEADSQNLRKALAKEDSEQVDRTVQSLERHLLDNEGYKQLGDERVLSTSLRLLHQVYGDEIKDRLIPLAQWLEIIRDINDKFFAIINHDIDLDELLFLYLSSWKILEIEISCSFDEVIKQKLKDSREKSNTEQKIRSFMSHYLEYLSKHVQNTELFSLEEVLKLVLGSLKRYKQRSVQALFSLGHVGDVYGITIQATAGGTGSIDVLNEIDLDMKEAAKGAFTFVKNTFLAAKTWDITWDIERGDIPFSGNSIGLALTLGILSSIEGFEIDPYTAFTGHVVWHSGDVKGVGELSTKLRAAKELGIRRVFIPSENSKDIPSVPDLDIVPVATVEEAKTKLIVKSYISSNITFEKLAELKLKELEIELASKGVKSVGGIQNGENYKRIIFTDFHEQVFVNVHFGKNGITPNVQQKNCSLRNTIQAVCDQVFGKNTEESAIDRKRSKYVVGEKDARQRVETYLFSLQGSIRETEQNCSYRSKISKNGQIVYVRQFNSGTLTIDGTDPLFSDVDCGIQAVLGVTAPSFTISTNHRRLETQIEAVRAVDLGDKWIGTDEAGKGDYFGPLVGAAVFIDKDLVAQLQDIGVRDSKKLSDSRNRELAIRINAICGKRAQVVVVSPARYNQLYEQFRREGKNLNTLLAWVHTRALEDILTLYPQNQITVIIDKFADEHYIKSKLLEKSRKTDLNLVQLPKAEANIAVAAASILARAQFLNWLDRISYQFNLSLPKGASDPNIVKIAGEIVHNYGADKLAEIAKLHFKTTKKVL